MLLLLLTSRGIEYRDVTIRDALLSTLESLEHWENADIHHACDVCPGAQEVCFHCSRQKQPCLARALEPILAQI
jgi:hypothetical protein